MSELISEGEFELIWGARTKPSGDFFEYEDVKNMDIHYVWTVVETGGDDRSWYASPGFHVVNKLGYVVTAKPWTTGDEEAVWFLYDFDDDDEDSEDNENDEDGQ